METQKSERGRRLVELRRSGASGLHRKVRKDRRNVLRKAIAQSREDG